MPNKHFVINVAEGKVKSIVKWTRNEDGSLNYEYVPIPKPLSKNPAPQTVKTYYQAIGLSASFYNLSRKQFSNRYTSYMAEN